MAIANKKEQPGIRKQRWLKYFTYIFFTSIIITGIFFNFFYWLALIIVIVSFIELLKINLSASAFEKIAIVQPFIIFLPVAAGFILFAKTFNYPFFLFIYFQVIVFDGFCQITGQLLGKHQLAPAISPSKTVEGLVGGWLCCIAAALMAANWVQLSLLSAAIFGLLTGLTSFSGDMLASWYKRKLKIKDYSNWLPGQGGFLDRFDSLLVTGAVYYYLMLFFDQHFNF